MEVSESSQVKITEHDSGVVEVEKAYLSEAVEVPPEAVDSGASEAIAVEKPEAESSSAGPEVTAPESLDAELSVPPSNTVVGSGPTTEQVYEIPGCGDDQPSTQASWKNCCGLLDVLRGSNQ